MMFKVKVYHSLIAMILVWLILIFGCIDRNIDAFEENAGFYSIYGSLNVDEHTHYIRINNVQIPVISGAETDFDGTVRFLDLYTEANIQLQDTVVNFSGFITHNFILNQSLELDRAYQLIVERTDGSKTVSSVTTPGKAIVSIEPNEDVFCHAQIEFRFQNVKKPEHVNMEVGLSRFEGIIEWSEIGLVDRLKHRMKDDEVSVVMSPKDLLVEVFPPDRIPAWANPRTLIPRVSCNDLYSNIVHVRYTHFGPEWDIYSPGFFPIDPLEWQDVEGGLGFLGAYREGSATFTIN